MAVEEISTYTASTPTDIRTVRHGLRHQLCALGMSDERIDEAVIITSELVANVLGHTESVALVTVATEAERLRVAVADRSSLLPVLRPVDPARVGGNGLRIVDDFAETWGATAVPDEGKLVWFTVRIH